MGTCICGRNKESAKLRPKDLTIKLVSVGILIAIPTLILSGDFAIGAGRGIASASGIIAIAIIIWFGSTLRAFNKGHKFWCAPLFSLLDGGVRFINL